jgi:hypothetical protein
MAVLQEWIMNKTIALALAVSALVAFPVATPSFAVDTSISAKCGPDAPESYKRPGGYCDQIGANGSLMEPKDDCSYYYVSSVDLKHIDETVLVAANCYYLPAVASS